MDTMFRETLNALAACLVTFVLCAVVYPAAVWGLAQLAFPYRAGGSLIEGRGGTVLGSELVAQPFASAGYFHPRPSAVAYKADAAGGSNLGSKNPDLRKQVAERARALGATAANPAPLDLVTASGSGLDPHISPEAARFQADRVAAARKLPPERIQALIDRHVERSGSILGAPPRVNVLLLNLDLDREAGAGSGVGAGPTAAR
jgi:K+-transporting ATPase ATPase C chain